MRQYLLSLSSAAAVLFMLSLPATAQDDKEKDKEKDKNKVKQYDEIIIRKKSDKDSKVTVEIKDGQVTVNGKPLEDFDDENVTVRKRGTTVTINGVHSPFRSQGGAWSYGDHDAPAFNFSDSKGAFLGVSTGESKAGAEVEEVTDKSAAEKAGLKKGDVITKIDNESVFSQEDVSKQILKHKPEDKVTITYKRDGKEQKTTATLGKRSGAFAFNGDNFTMPAMPAMPVMPNMDFNWDGNNGLRGLAMSGRPRLGIKAQDTEDGKGVKVLDVDDESAAGKAGIKEDDIITEFDGKTVNSADELADAARGAKEKTSVNVKLKRDGKVQSVDIKTPKKLKTANL
jgi:serine protease Do